MRHHILVKWKEGCKPGLEPIRELFQETLAIPGVESVELHPNVIDRPNRYDLLILLCMEKARWKPTTAARRTTAGRKFMAG